MVVSGLRNRPLIDRSPRFISIHYVLQNGLILIWSDVASQ